MQKKLIANNFKVMVVCQICHTTYDHTDNIIGGGESFRCSFFHLPQHSQRHMQMKIYFKM